MQIRYFVVVLSALLIFGGLYFRLLYDVPDGQETTNNLVSWFLVVIGISGIMVSTMWQTRNPLALDDKDNQYDYLKRDKNTPRSKSRFSRILKKDSQSLEGDQGN